MGAQNDLFVFGVDELMEDLLEIRLVQIAELDVVQKHPAVKFGNKLWNLGDSDFWLVVEEGN